MSMKGFVMPPFGSEKYAIRDMEIANKDPNKIKEIEFNKGIEYGDKVEIIDGFYKGSYGTIQDFECAVWMVNSDSKYDIKLDSGKNIQFYGRNKFNLLTKK